MPGNTPISAPRPRKASRVLVLALLLFSLPGWATIELQQADGSLLTLPAPAATIITLAPHLTELAFAAGAGGQLIATVEYSEFPPAAASIPRIGDAFRLDLERILSLKPDLVVAWQSGNPQQAIARLSSLGIATWTIEIRRPGEIATTLEQFGRATGNVDHALEAAREIRLRLQTLSGQYSGLPPVSYFYQVSAHPLYTINGEHLIARSLALCGGINIFQSERGLAPQVSHEAVIAADPSALLAPAEPAQQDPLGKWREWPRMRAVRNEAMFLLPADEISRATPRLLNAVTAACHHLDQVRSHNDNE